MLLACLSQIDLSSYNLNKFKSGFNKMFQVREEAVIFNMLLTCLSQIGI